MELLTDWMTNADNPLCTKITDELDDVYHKHTFIEIFYVLDGSIEHILNNNSEIINVGDLYFMSTDDAHIFLRKKDTVCSHRDIIITKEFFKSVSDFINPQLQTDLFNKSIPIKAKLDTYELRELEQTVTELTQTPLSNTALRISKMKILLILLLKKFVTSVKQNKNNYPIWFEELLLRFNVTLYLSGGLKEILHPFNFDQSYICRTFKKYMGITMTDFLNEKRIRHAANLMLCTNDTIISIASKVGIQSIAYFNKKFKEIYKVSPRQFRNYKGKPN